MAEKLAVSRNLILAAVGLALLAGLIPIVLALAALGGVRSLKPPQAIAILEGKGGPAALVDVRPEAEFAARRVQGAVNLPLEGVLRLNSPAELPPQLHGKALVVLCAAGFDSARAARHLAAIGVTAYNVRGGLQEWGRDGPRLALSGEDQQSVNGSYPLIGGPGGEYESLFRALSQAEQSAAAAGLAIIKPVYMLLSLVLIYLLRRSRAVDLQIAGWGILLFWLGEVACAIHYTLLKDDSYLAEYLHSYGMVLAFAVTAYAVLEAFDRRLLHFSAPQKRCAMVELCGACIKNPASGMDAAQCGLHRLALLLLPVGALLALIPLTAPLSYRSFNTQIGPVLHFYIRTVIQQMFEMRYSPLAAVFLFGLAWAVLLLTPRYPVHPLARVLACGGFGFLGFSYFRTTLGLVYESNLALATFWEEATELVFILVALYVQWVFRRTLLRGNRMPDWVMYVDPSLRSG